ncbi:unnamed protein product [Orchesella dallaii]|uniref:Uncharacterized protein n=1 Tax=Orchesella dallaii TaxID=48710 RepID=A0ABP1R0U9_9HEXA
MCKWNPCLCITLERGVKLIAIFEIVVTLIIALSYCYALCFPERVDRTAEHDDKTVNIISLVVLILYIFLNIGLYNGADEKKTGICWAWIGIKALQIITSVLMLIINIPGIGYPKPNDSDLTANIVILIITIVESYKILVVCSFVRKVRQQQRQVGVLHPNEHVGGGESGRVARRRGSSHRVSDGGNNNNNCGEQQPVYYPSQLQPNFVSVTV